MDAREAYLRRAYRIALLLTDDEETSAAVLERVARAVPNPESTSDARFDRAVIQAARPVHEPPGHAAGALRGRFGLSGDADRLWSRLHDLEPQTREAWVLRELEGMDPIRAARAMDCSKTALEQIHLASAVSVLRGSMGDAYEGARDEIARHLDGLDASGALARIESVLRAHKARSRLVTLVSVIALLIFFGLLAYVLFDLLAWDEREDRVRDTAAEAYSNPMPREPEGGDE